MKWNSQPLCLPQDRAKDFNAVDLTRFVCALLVVMIHCSPLSDYGKSLDFPLFYACTRMAVPFFFVAAGYFLFRRTSPDDFDPQPCRVYIKRMLRLYLVWTVLYFPWVWRNTFLTSENSIAHSLLWYIKSVLLTDGGYGKLWFLHAMIVAPLVLTVLLAKKVRLKHILLLAVGLYAVGLTAQSYAVVLQPLRGIPPIWRLLKLAMHVIPNTYRTGLFFGMLYMSIGMALAWRPVVLPLRTVVFGLVVSVFLLAVEIRTVNALGWAYGHDSCIFLVPAVFFLFYLVSHIEIAPCGLWRYLRNMSGLIYYLHPAVLEWGGVLNLPLPGSVAKYLAAVLVTIAVAHVILKASSRKGLGWLKLLYK